MSARAVSTGSLLVALVGLAIPAGAETVAITGGRVFPVAGPPIEGGTVVIRDGRIAAVGAAVEVPAGARVIDAAGKWVTPGLFDSVSRVGLVEIDAYRDTTEAAVEDDRLTAAFDVVDGLDPWSTPVAVTRIEGVTRVLAVPQPGTSLIAGRAAVLQLGSTRLPDARQMVTRPRAAMVVVLGNRGAELSGGARGGAMMRLREALEDARDFAANRRAWESAAHRDYPLSRLDLEALEPVVRGEMPLAIRADRAADLLAALRLAEEQRLRLVLLGAADGWLVADRLAAAGVAVAINPLQNLPDFESLGATLENASRLHRAGVTVLLASFDAHNTRNVKHAAGNAVAYGMPWDAALRALTLAPARVWGVADRLGSLEPGKEADVVVWSGDPFELLTTAEHVFIAGAEVPRDSRQRRLFQRYRHLSGALPPAFHP